MLSRTSCWMFEPYQSKKIPVSVSLKISTQKKSLQFFHINLSLKPESTLSPCRCRDGFIVDDMVKTMESPEDRSTWVSIGPALKALWSWSTYLFVYMCIYTYCWWKASCTWDKKMTVLRMRIYKNYLLIGVSFLPSTVCTLVCLFDYVKIDLFIVVLKSFKFESEFLSVF